MNDILCNIISAGVGKEAGEVTHAKGVSKAKVKVGAADPQTLLCGSLHD